MIYEADKGEMFYYFIRRMKQECIINKQSYRDCVFNGIYFTIFKDSNMDDISIIYDLKIKLTQNNIKC